MANKDYFETSVMLSGRPCMQQTCMLTKAIYTRSYSDLLSVTNFIELPLANELLLLVFLVVSVLQACGKGFEVGNLLSRIDTGRCIRNPALFKSFLFSKRSGRSTCSEN